MIFNRDKDARLERRRQALERIDKRGRLHYVLTTGVLGWGGFMFVIMTCIDIFVWEPCQGTARKARLRMEI